MAVFEPFLYHICNLSAAVAMEAGARIGKIVDIVAAAIKTAGTSADCMACGQDFIADWFADTLVGQSA